MKKILILSDDTLFGNKIQRDLKHLGGITVRVSDPAGVEDYLASGEVGLIIAEGDWRLSSWKDGLASWTMTPGIKVILCGDDLPGDLDSLAADCGADYRLVEKSLLLKLSGEIFGEFAPEFLAAGEGKKTVPVTHERRGSGRMEKSLRIFFEVPEKSAGREALCRTVNISSDGAMIISRQALEPDTRLNARILLPYFSEMIPLKARVIWSRPAAGKETFASGLFFDRMNDSDRFSLINYLSRDSI
jgi:hypothetical protein